MREIALRVSLPGRTTRLRTRRVSIIVPTCNEAANVGPVVTQIVASAVPFREILFVHAESGDGTGDVVRPLAALHPIRLPTQDRAAPGLAASIVAGARAAEGELLLIMDADLSHPPAEIRRLLTPVLADTADTVIESRYIEGGSTPGWPLWPRILSRAGAMVAFPLTGVRDSMSGFFAIERSRLLDLAPRRLGSNLLLNSSPPPVQRCVSARFRSHFEIVSAVSRKCPSAPPSLFPVTG